jgi:beta-galactosidase
LKKTFILSVFIGFLSFVPAAEAANGGLADFGVAYYPEAWPEERWETDVKMMRELGMSLVRIGEFNWGKFEPTEGVFDFKPYLRFLNICEKHGMKVMMCTPTAATPKWMQRDWPETLKTRADGSMPGPGARQESCASSEKFRFFSRRITCKMAEAFKNHPAVTTWQLDNELSILGGTGLCECERCRQGFISYLKKRFGTLEELNRAFNGAFWSGSFSKWDDVRLPLHDTRCAWRAEYTRYQGERFLSYILEQMDILRRTNPKWRLTTNNPSASGFARHDVMFRNLGYAAADTYICWDEDAGKQADFMDTQIWTWAMFRGLTGKQKPFMIGESGAFSFNADVPYSYDLVKPFFYLTIGFGAESFMYFRWRESVNGEESHPAILPWTGRKTFVYEMMKKQMDEYRSLPESIARLPLDKGDVVIVHDAESHIYSLTHAYACRWKGTNDKLFDTERFLHSALVRRGVKVDLMQLSDDMDLSRYKVAFFPQHYTVSPTTMRKIREYASAGGTAVAVNRFNFAEPLGWNFRMDVGPAGMTDFFGIEIDERRAITGGNVELAVPTTAETVCSLEGTCFKGRPWLTRREVDKGSAWYVTQVPTRDMCRELVTTILPRAGVPLREELPDGVFRLTRGDYVIVVNFTMSPQTIAAEEGVCLLGDPVIADGLQTLKPLAVAVYRSQPVLDRLGSDIRDRIYSWGYVLDRTPSACPFLFGKTTVSLENAVSMFGANKAFYMNSMFCREYILKYFPKWDRECFANCVDTKLSDRHWDLLKDVPEVWCALQHGDKLGSAKRIATLSLTRPNIKGINIDDFKDGNPANDMTPEELTELRRTIQAINPALKVSIVTYGDDNRLFDLAPYREAVDLVSRWKWTVDSTYWSEYEQRLQRVRAQLGTRVKIVQGLYLHDFGIGMESRIPLPLDYFKRTTRKACEAVAKGLLDGIILPQGSWYSSPAHKEHVEWLRHYLSYRQPRNQK